jgi:DNA primase
MPALRQSVSFAQLKQTISISQVLDRYGLLQRLHRSGDNLNGVCPLHSGHNPTQFRVSLSKNCWICFGDCQAGGSILDFVSRKERVTIHQAALLLQNWFGHTGIPLPGQKCCQLATFRQPTKPAQNRVLRFRLWGLTFHPYLVERGLHWKTIRTFGLGYCSSGCMAGRIVIPIHNRDGNLVAYAGRWPGNPPEGTPKYKLPQGFMKNLELFNVHRALAATEDDALKVVEGFFGCMAVWQAGFKKVVALMGSSISDEQRHLMIEAAQPSRRVDLLLDEDAAGRKAREKACEFLAGFVDVRVITFPAEGLQPDRISAEMLRSLLA